MTVMCGASLAYREHRRCSQRSSMGHRSPPIVLFCRYSIRSHPALLFLHPASDANVPHSGSRLPIMTLPIVTASDIRIALLRRDEIALLDVRREAAFATGHPLFAANMAADRIALEAETRLPRKEVPIVVYDAGEGLGAVAIDRLTALGYTHVRALDGGLEAWQAAGYELFQDVNSYAKA